MNTEQFTSIVKRIVARYEREILDEDDTFDDNVHIVWQTKALANFKATAITDDTVGKLYYELTYNGDNGLIYLDVYKKQANEAVVSDFVYDDFKRLEDMFLYGRKL